jgi:cytochrome c
VHGQLPAQCGIRHNRLERPMKAMPPFAAAALLATLFAGQPAAASEQISVKATCATCHAATKKIIGPSWHDVAVKYKGKADAPALLAQRVRKGGKDVWGPVAMMPLGPDRISDADLKAMIAWVLKTP